MKITNLHLLSAPALVCALVFEMAAVVRAVPPPNDNFAAPTVVAGLPYSDEVDISEATTEPGEPLPCSFSTRTIWYSLTLAEDSFLRADPFGSSFPDSFINVYRSNGPGFQDLALIGCVSYVNPIPFLAKGGATYYIQTGSQFSTGSLQLNLDVIPAPPNDDFEAAAVITSLPFNDVVDATAATLESGEAPPSCYPGTGGTVWYAFTPATSGSVSAIAGWPFVTAVYTGDSLDALNAVACAPYYNSS